jgi:hypothetical protein
MSCLVFVSKDQIATIIFLIENLSWFQGANFLRPMPPTLIFVPIRNHIRKLDASQISQIFDDIVRQGLSPVGRWSSAAPEPVNGAADCLVFERLFRRFAGVKRLL